jgi:hypothetical protein
VEHVLILGTLDRIDQEKLGEVQSFLDRLWDLLIVQRLMSDRNVPHQLFRLCAEMLFGGLLDLNVQETGKAEDMGVFLHVVL